MRRMTSEEFRECVIAQDDDCDYQESGWVAGILDGVAFLAHYSHCSCFNTFEALTNDGSVGIPDVDWEGSPEALRLMAHRKLDPSMPGRVSDPNDRDYDHLMEVYRGVLEHFATNPPTGV